MTSDELGPAGDATLVVAVSRFQREALAEVYRAASIALTEEDARTAELVGDCVGETTSAVLTVDGSGYLLAHHLSDLPAGRTHQLLGGARGDLVISLGVLGAHPGDVVASGAGSVSTRLW